MLTFTQFASTEHAANATVTLPLQQREKSRLRVQLSDGQDAAIMLDRGTQLRHGDKLISDCGVTVAVVAAKELVSFVECHDALLFARACYHLGNRHVQLQINNHALSYLHDHVLDSMLEQLGLTVISKYLAFTPEHGAYDVKHKHAHQHTHAHAHPEENTVHDHHEKSAAHSHTHDEALEHH